MVTEEEIKQMDLVFNIRLKDLSTDFYRIMSILLEENKKLRNELDSIKTLSIKPVEDK
jgi:hypothetical protein